MAGTTIAAMILAVVPLAVSLILAKPWIGKGGVIALGLILGHFLPWLAFLVFYRLEPTGSSLDL